MHLASIVEDKGRSEINQVLKEAGVMQSLISTAVDILEQIGQAKGNKKYSSLLKKVHYS